MNRFGGIINHLTKKFSGNVSEKGVCKITSSSVFDKYLPKNVVDYDNQNQRHVFSSLIEQDSWIKFDFVGRVVHPNAYSIRTTIHKRGDVHLKNWVIEGSNNDKSWKVLDSRKDESSFINPSSENTFNISMLDNEYYRYIRLRQNGPNFKGTGQLVMSKFELFGTIK